MKYLFYSKRTKIYVFLLFIFALVFSLNMTGPVNSKYHISSYYGSRVLGIFIIS